MPLLDGMSPICGGIMCTLPATFPLVRLSCQRLCWAGLAVGAAPHGGRSPADAGGVVA